MNNSDLALYVFSFLKKVNCQTVVVCAGARNAPLVLSLENQKFKVFTFFEERSAAFFALGLIKNTKKPVAVITTSGTAAAELLPATIEAHYQGLPLILITADRPKTYRGSGAPQAIEQVGLFSAYVEKVYDFDVHNEEFSFEWSLKRPLHLNISFAEPLVDQKILNSHEVKLNISARNPEKLKTVSSVQNPLVILGEFDKKYREKVLDFIIRTKAPVYAESISQLRGEKSIEPFLIKSGEQLVNSIFKRGICDSILRIGGVPTLRFWRDLEEGFKDLPVISFSDVPFSGLSRPAGIVGIENLNFSSTFPEKKLQEITDTDYRFGVDKMILLKKYPESEQSLVWLLSQAVKTDPVYLGNSLPIRHWDHFADACSSAIGANRGANGIDGQISTYLGWSENFSNSYCLIGDLTALYDLAALGFTSQLTDNRRNVVIINNFGGQIFNRVFKNNDFINSHKTQFSDWAKMWNWNYMKVSNAADLGEMRRLITDKNVIEIQPDAGQTSQFWKDWDQICQQL